MFFYLETPCRGTYNEYPKHMFSCRNEKNSQTFCLKESALSPIQIYWKFYHQKMKIFRWKILIYFSYFCSKHRLWVLIRTAQWGSSNKYPQAMFLSRNKKNNVYSYKLQFYCIKVGFKGGQNYIDIFLWWVRKIQLTLVISNSLISNSHLSWSENLVPA